MFIRAILLDGHNQVVHDPLIPALQPLPDILQCGSSMFILIDSARAMYREALLWPIFQEHAIESRFGALVARRNTETV